MVENLFEKFFEAIRHLANMSNKLKHATIDNEAGIAVVEYDTNMGFYSNILRRHVAISVKLVIHKPDRDGDIMIDIVLPLPGIDACSITKRISKRIERDLFVPATAREVNRAAFNIALDASRTIAFIDQVSTDEEEPATQLEQSDYDKSLEKLVTALSMKYQFVKLIESDDFTTHFFEDTDTYYSYSSSSNKKVCFSVVSEYDDGLLNVTVRVCGPDMPKQCLYKEIVITPGEDAEDIAAAVVVIHDLVEKLRDVLDMTRPMW